MISFKQIFITIISVFFLFRFIYLKYYKWHTSRRVKKEFKNKNSKFIEIDGVFVHYVDEGEGIPVVLLHGTGASFILGICGLRDWRINTEL